MFIEVLKRYEKNAFSGYNPSSMKKIENNLLWIIRKPLY